MYQSSKKFINFNTLFLFILILIGAYNNIMVQKAFNIFYYDYLKYDAFKLSELSNETVLNSNFFTCLK